MALIVDYVAHNIQWGFVGSTLGCGNKLVNSLPVSVKSIIIIIIGLAVEPVISSMKDEAEGNY